MNVDSMNRLEAKFEKHFDMKKVKIHRQNIKIGTLLPKCER